MSSKAQKTAGYPIPEVYQTEDTASYCIVIPAGEEFRQAAYAQLVMLGKWWKWKHNDNPDSQRAKHTAETWRTIFQLNETCGGFLMTPEEFYDSNKRSIYDAWNDIAKQIVSGRTTNIAVGADGAVTDPTTGAPAVPLPEDDPTTPAIDETAAANYGGTYAVMKALELFYSRLDTYYGATNGTPVLSEAQAFYNIKNLFSIEDAVMSAAITAYYSYRMTNGKFNFITNTPTILYFYCHGSNERGWLQWLTDISGFAYEKQVRMSDLSLGLAADFWTGYYNKGLSTPSSDYLDASCVKSPTEIGYITTLGVAFISQTAWKPNHRIRITTEGYFTDADGDTVDTWWYVDPPNVPANRLALNTSQVGSNATDPSLNVVPYNAAHKYVWTMDNGAVAADYRLTVSATGMTTPTSPTSGIKVTVEDLGEINSL